jgi:hypothetical protein
LNFSPLKWSTVIPLIAVTVCSAVGAPSDRKLVLHGATTAVEIPLQGMTRDDDSVQLAGQIQKSQVTLTNWRRGIGANDPAAQRLNDLVVKLQDDTIRDLRDGYQIASNTSGKFPDEKKSDIQKLLELCETILSHGPKFQDRVITHITTVPGGSLHFQAYDSTSKEWSTYSDGEIMDTGGYQFRVSGTNIKPFQEFVVIIDNPYTHSIAP